MATFRRMVRIILHSNDVDDADGQRAIILGVIRARTYQILQSLVAPLKPKEKSVDEIQ